MTPSLSEINATGRKSAKGAGYSWGMADEAGRATAWLWEHGIDSISALADLLDHGAPQTCPLYIGTRLCDAPENTAEFATVTSPILLLSFAAELGKITEKTIVLRIGDGLYYATAEAMFCETEGFSGPVQLHITSDAPKGARMMPAPRRDAPAKAWARLNEWAHKTYAPATEASRLAGAGAGLSDND
jgi:hypothetical protein